METHATTTTTTTFDPAADPRWASVSRDPYPLLIGGRLAPAADGAVFPAISPRDNEPVAKISQAGPDDVAAAVGSARQAFDEGPWGRTTARDRAAALLRIADLIEKHADELAFLETIDAGKPISSVHYSDLSISLDSLRYFGGRARTTRGAVAEMPDASVVHHELIEPLGVVVEILPWNGPLWTGIQRMAAILAAGNAAIVKPAQMASLCFMRVAQLLVEADLPPGAVNVLAGPGGSVGEALVADPRVDMISLTGGIETGSRILEAAASQVKRISLELGGKNPNLVFADADLDTAVFWSTLGAFGNTGQICVCGSRILVERSIQERFVDALVAKAEAMKVGEPLDPSTELGPVIAASHAAKVWDYIAIGKREATLRTGGTRYTDPIRSKGAYIPPTVFVDATPTCRIAREEIFGPVATILPFDTEAEALAIANDTTYGLSAGVFTRDLDRGWRLARGLKAGQVYVNQWFSTGVLEAPGHGYKQSGYGGVGIEKYQQHKQIVFRIADAGR
ncbi:MAG TPA: aldehyde dehydrogenase family protein [Candidatus Limnocylindrales bacterium]|nr:aldehyde dehydrogenase family protein [Candidatus Limnocylindrales bacterium]